MHIAEYVRLGFRGFLLDQEAYRQQRESSNRFKEGFILVLLIGLLVGLATMIGEIGATLTSPDFEQIISTLYDGLTNMPWYINLTRTVPGFADKFRQNFDNVVSVFRFMEGGGIVGAISNLITIPLSFLLTWVIYGVVAHIVARMVGGTGTLTQTLGCTALAAGANVLSLIKVIPYAEVSGVLLMTLLANYLALRIAHELTPRRAFWATIAAPLLLVVFAGIGGCVLFIALQS